MAAGVAAPPEAALLLPPTERAGLPSGFAAIEVEPLATWLLLLLLLPSLSLLLLLLPLLRLPPPPPPPPPLLLLLLLLLSLSLLLLSLLLLSLPLLPLLRLLELLLLLLLLPLLVLLRPLLPPPPPPPPLRPLLLFLTSYGSGNDLCWCWLAPADPTRPLLLLLLLLLPSALLRLLAPVPAWPERCDTCCSDLAASPKGARKKRDSALRTATWLLPDLASTSSDQSRR
jgi:hypothetical protein